MTDPILAYCERERQSARSRCSQAISFSKPPHDEPPKRELRKHLAEIAVLESVVTLRNGLPNECTCHESYRVYEKALGYRFKDPDCRYCGMDDELRTLDSALEVLRKEIENAK